MDAPEAARLYADALLAALDEMKPQMFPATRAQLYLALQAKLGSALQQPELLAPTALLLTELGRRGAEALAEEDQRRSKAAEGLAEEIAHRLAAARE